MNSYVSRRGYGETRLASHARPIVVCASKVSVVILFSDGELKDVL